jgi:hypothetical protein
MARPRPRRLAIWLAGAAVAVALLAVGGAFIYIHFISGPAPAPLGLKPGEPAATTPVTQTQPAASSARWPAPGGWRPARSSATA